MGVPAPRLSVLLSLVLLAAGGTRLPAQSGDAPLPSKEALIQKVRESVRLDYELQTDYMYVEQRRDVKLTKFGKVTVGPPRTFEVYPSTQPGRTYKRLIAVNGKPLEPAELARRDAEHRQNVIEQAEQMKNESPAERRERLKKEADERRERDALIADAFLVFEPTIVGRETMDGRPVIVADLAPRPHARPRTREGGWMKNFRGRVWVAEEAGQIAKIDMVASDDITVGWGIVGRVHKGSRLVFARRLVNGEAWLPAESHIVASGRTLLFRPFDVELHTRYRDYRKWKVGTSESFTGAPPTH